MLSVVPRPCWHHYQCLGVCADPGFTWPLRRKIAGEYDIEDDYDTIYKQILIECRWLKRHNKPHVKRAKLELARSYGLGETTNSFERLYSYQVTQC